MARRKEEGEGVSLFPFMSILVCLIGGLTLMITSMMAGQANSEQSQEVVDRYQEYAKLKAEVEQSAEELEKLKEMLARADELRKQSQAALEEIAALEKKQKDQAERSGAKEHQELLAEANRLRKRIAEIEQEPANLQKRIDELKKEVEKRQAGPEEAIVQIRPGGSGLDLVPTFVECTASGVVVHEGKEPQRILAADLAKEDGDFRKLLEKVAAVRKGQVIFLVRPDAVGVYNTARYVARTHYGPNGYTKNGKLPVPTQGNIDLSIFRR